MTFAVDLEDSRALKATVTEVVQRLVGILQRVAPHISLDRDLRREPQELLSVSTRQIGDRPELSLGAVVIQWIAMGVLSKYAEPEDETVLSLILEAFAWMAIGVLLPVLLGRMIRQAIEESRHSGATSEC